MPRTILIAVSDGFGGYGDFLFALKLAEQIKKHYVTLLGADNAPEVKLATQPSGQQKIKNLQGDTEFDVEVLTPDELKEKVEKKELEVTYIIEGPVFQSSLMIRINAAIQQQTQRVPLIMMPEYAYSSIPHRERLNNVYPFARTKDFNSFVQHYVNEPYDFSPYTEILGEDAIELLNNMQNKTPEQRPSIEEALEILKPKEPTTILESVL